MGKSGGLRQVNRMLRYSESLRLRGTTTRTVGVDDRFRIHIDKTSTLSVRNRSQGTDASIKLRVCLYVEPFLQSGSTRFYFTLATLNSSDNEAGLRLHATKITLQAFPCLWPRVCFSKSFAQQAMLYVHLLQEYEHLPPLSL